VHDGVGRASIPVSSEPRSIRWDKGDWLLDVTDFPRPTTMLAYQLAHDDDVTGRLEAIELLGERSDELVALRALAAAARDTLVSVRQHAVGALARQGSIPLAADAILAATRDADARVRREAATSLASVRTGAASSRARELATSDPSLLVQGAALLTVGSLDGPRALDLIRTALARDSWRDLSRTYGVRALATLDAPETMPLLTPFLASTTSRNTRVAAIDAFVKRSKGHQAEVAATIVPLLNADDLFVRGAAATALGRLGQSSAVGALQARKRIEAESRVVNLIDAALANLAR
jgi:aminopeptidase N